MEQSEGGLGLTRGHKKSPFDEYIKEVQKEIDRKEEEIYSEEVLREARNPKNVGRMSNPDGAAIFKGACGDTMEIYVKTDGDTLKDINFFTDGCGPSVACGSMLTQLAKGRTVEESRSIGENELIDNLGGLPEESVHCAELAIRTFKMALGDLDADEYGKSHSDTR